MKLLLIDDCERFTEEYLQFDLEDFFLYRSTPDMTTQGLNDAIKYQFQEWQTGPILLAWTSTILPEEAIINLITNKDTQDVIVTGKGRISESRPPREFSVRKGRLLPGSLEYHHNSVLNVFLIQRPEDLKFLAEDPRHFSEIFMNSLSPLVLSCTGFKSV